jgi:hypothetical protein
MKKLLIVFIAVLGVTSFLEKAFAQGCKFDNFFLEHSQGTVRPERFIILKDALMINAAGENFEGEGESIVHSEFISPSHLTDQDTQYKTSDGFDINLKRLSEDMEQFGLTFKVTKLDSAYIEPDDSYFKGFNYSFALSYTF